MNNGMMNQGNTKQTKRTANRRIHKFCKMFSTMMGNQTSTAMNRKNILDAYSKNTALKQEKIYTKH